MPSKTSRMVAYIAETEYIEGHGYRVCFVFEDSGGYYPTGNWPYTGAVGETMPWFWGHDLAAAKQHADSYNELMGFTPREAAMVVAKSIQLGDIDKRFDRCN